MMFLGWGYPIHWGYLGNFLESANSNEPSSFSIQRTEAFEDYCIGTSISRIMPDMCLFPPQILLLLHATPSSFVASHVLWIWQHVMFDSVWDLATQVWVSWYTLPGSLASNRPRACPGMVVSHVCIPCFKPFSAGREDRFCHARFQTSTRFSVGFEAIGLPAPGFWKVQVSQRTRSKNIKDGPQTRSQCWRGLPWDSKGCYDGSGIQGRKGACRRQDFHRILNRCKTHQQARDPKLPKTRLDSELSKEVTKTIQGFYREELRKSLAVWTRHASTRACPEAFAVSFWKFKWQKYGGFLK